MTNDLVSIILPSGKSIDIQRQSYRFNKWQGPPIKDDYNGKAIIDFQGKPLFAELVILRMYQQKGWDGVWVDCYRRKFRTDLPEKSNSITSLPQEQEDIINSIKKVNGKLSGCWDLFLWKDKGIKFIELKRLGKDQIRISQKRWLNSALSVGVSRNAFIVIEWDFV